MLGVSEQETDNALYEQLAMLDKIEAALDEGGVRAAREEIEKFKKEVGRKMEQKPIVPGL